MLTAPPGGVFPREVAHRGEIGVAELEVAVGIDSPSARREAAVLEDRQRVCQLGPARSFPIEQLVQASMIFVSWPT